MRVAAVHFPELRVEVLRATAPTLVGRPVAIVVAPAPLTEQNLLGNTRIDVVSREAHRLGVREGSTIAQARARASELAVRVVRPDAVRDVLARLAEIALAFGATVSFSMEDPSPDSFGDVVWVDVTGCAHLHGPTQAEGESTMASRLAHVMSTLGHRCSVAIAEGPRVAAMLARAISRSGTRSDTDNAFVVPPGENARALAPLPVSSLPIDKDDARWLAKVGVATVAEMRALPRAALAKRLGERAGLLLGLADGDDRAPLTPHVPPEIPEESVTLEYGVEGQEALLFVTKTLTDRIAARLAGRAVATTRLELRLGLDAALTTEDARASITMELPAPLSVASDLLAALKPKLERLVLAAPVLTAKLSTPVLVRKPQAALSLFDAEPKADRALPRLVAELSADLGEEAVGKLALGDAWVPEERSRFVRLSAQHELPLRKKKRHLVSSVPEPNRFLAEPVPVPRKELEIVRHLVRLERVDWWRMLPGQESKHGADFVMATLDDGMALVEIDRTNGAARVRGWFD